MSSFIALRKTLDLSADNNRHLLVGRQSRDLPQVAENGAVVTALKKHYDMSVDVQFDSNGGTACDGMTYVLGSTYKDLPVPTRAQHIFNGWATATGQILTDSSLVELSNTTLTAQWEYVDIGSDCTEYIVSCNSSYKNTGIYAANRYSSTSAVYVDWGDGNVDKVDGNISKLSHSYTNAGTYSVKVSNNLTSFAPSYNDSTWYNTTSQNRYTFKSMVKTGSRMTLTAAMPSYAFYYCSSLSSIDWLSSCYAGLTALPSYAFYYCQGVKSLSSLPSRIKSLGSHAFYYCTGLTGIQDLRSTGLTSLYNNNVFQYCTHVTEWKLPSTLIGTYFGSFIFGNNSALSAIQLPESLTAIASECFYHDTQLKNISIPEKVQLIGNSAFYGCTSLNNVSIKATNLTAINQFAFYNCNKLVNLDLPDTVKVIGSYAYQSCYSLKKLDIPSSLTVLNDYAFAGCYNLSSIVDCRLTAQATYTNTFGNTASNNASNGYTGYATHGSNILCTYVAAIGYDDGYWNDPLQNPTKCGFNRQYIDPENLRYCTISFDAGEGTVSETSRQIVYGRKIGELPKPTCPADKPYFGGWYTEADGAGTKYSADSIAPSQDSFTLHAFYSATKLQSYTVDISNGDWVLQDPNTNPDPSSYDGVYQSSRYWKAVPSGGCIVKMYIDVVGYTTFKVYIRSYGENNYSYAIALPPDVDPSTYSNAISQSYANTKYSATGGTAISNYTLVTYNLDGGEHRICIVYGHRDTVVRNDDRGYVLIPKEQ